MKKVTIIINNMGIGGAERYVTDSINEMLHRGILVELITLRPEKENNFLSECQIDKRNMTSVYIKNIYDIFGIIRLVKVLRRQRPDLVMTHLWFANTVGRLSSFLTLVPKVFSMEHSINSSKSWKQRIVDFFLQSLSDQIIAVSETVKKTLVDGGIKMSKITVAYVSLNTSRFRIEKSEREDNIFTFLFVGRLNPPKNIETIVKAFANLQNAKLLIAGVGESEKFLKNLAEKVGSKNIHFLGLVSDVPRLMASADCFVFVPLWEALGLVTVEALLSGLPVITTSKSAMAEFVIDGYNGLLVDNPTDVSELSGLMKKIMTERDLREKLKANTKNLKIDFSIEHNIDIITKLYSQK